ncbi:hypothetical protein A5780_32450 [Nocardia sp. 852002-20019_SCH5090214]|nr:hypothetical protein A5780_32450 [Nocardia sp. 852002-20019_SCH5090214]
MYRRRVIAGEIVEALAPLRVSDRLQISDVSLSDVLAVPDVCCGEQQVALSFCCLCGREGVRLPELLLVSLDGCRIVQAQFVSQSHGVCILLSGEFGRKGLEIN